MGLGKVAVLDDEPGAVFLVKRTLSEFDVSGFTTSDEFLNSLDTGFDCILLDVQLDEMSGYEICRQLRAQRKTENIPVIFISGDTTLSGRIAGYEAGGDDFITKPFDINELQAKVRRILAQQGYRRELISTVEESRQAAFEAMTHSAEQGEIVRFMEQISFCNSQASLADALLTLLSGFGLKAVVAFWPNTEDVSDKAAYFALNSAVHSYLILAFTSAKRVTLDIGFYYMANASGRLLGTVMSGASYQIGGLPACLASAAALAIAGWLATRSLVTAQKSLQ